jgi:hypothetical protein
VVEDIGVTGVKGSFILNKQEARQFAGEWVRAWNTHDLDQILAHHAQEVQFTSPFIVKLIGRSSDTILGKDDLRVYFEKGLDTYPELRFELINVLVGVDSVTLYYRSVRSMLAAEVMHFDESSKVVRTTAHGVAVLLVGVYLVLNLVIVAVGLHEAVTHPQYVTGWSEALFTSYGNPMMMIGVALLVFPQLVLGLSGFETGVSMMPLVRGEEGDDPQRPGGRIRNTRKMLTAGYQEHQNLLFAPKL